jgi:hypothetical protein
MRGQVAQDGTGSPHALAEPDGARRTAHLSRITITALEDNA